MRREADSEGDVRSGFGNGAAHGCSAAPSNQPLAQDVDETSTGGPVDGCRPALTEQDPHPDDVDSELQHPALDDTRLGDSVTSPVITEHTDVLVGVWSDHEAGELVVMVPGTDGVRVFESLRRDAPDPGRVVCMEATYTRDELFLLANRVDERIAASDGPPPHRTHFDIARNRLQVEFESESLRVPVLAAYVTRSIDGVRSSFNGATVWHRADPGIPGLVPSVIFVETSTG